MGNYLKKWCSLFLILAMLFSLNTGVAWADEAAAGNGALTESDENTDSENTEGTPEEPEEEPFSGVMTLEYAMDTALVNSSSVLEAANNLEKAKLDKKKIDRDAEKFYDKVGRPTEGKIDQTESYYQVLVYAPNMAAKQLEIAEESYELAVSSTVLNVITQYYTIANYGKTEVYTVKAYNNAINSYNVAKAKYKQGMIAKVDLMTAELQMNTARQTALTSRVNTVNAKRSLLAYIGMDPKTGFSIGTQMIYKPLGEINADAVVDSLIENSPAVAIAKTTYDIAGIQYECDSKYYLDFSYTAQVALAAYKNAETEYKKTLLDAEADAYNMVETLQDAEKQYTTALSSLASVEEGYRIAKLQYQYGLITYNDVQMAEAEIYSTEAKINSALMQYSIYKTALDNNLIVSQ
ncbi:MAG: TolC family protein [Bacillota bacterium]|jgi:hypothetical protein